MAEQQPASLDDDGMNGWSSQLALDFDPASTADFEQLVDMAGCLTDLGFDPTKFYDNQNHHHDHNIQIPNPADGHDPGSILQPLHLDHAALFSLGSVGDAAAGTPNGSSTAGQIGHFTPFSDLCAAPMQTSGNELVGLGSSHGHSTVPFSGYSSITTDFAQLTPLVSPIVGGIKGGSQNISASGTTRDLSFEFVLPPQPTPEISPALSGIATGHQHVSPSMMAGNVPQNDITMIDPVLPPPSLRPSHLTQQQQPTFQTQAQPSPGRKVGQTKASSQHGRTKQSPMIKANRRRGSVKSVSPRELQSLIDSSLAIPVSSAHSQASTLGSDGKTHNPATPSSILSLPPSRKPGGGGTPSSMAKPTPTIELDDLVLPGPMAKPDGSTTNRLRSTLIAHPTSNSGRGSESSTPSIGSQNTSPAVGPSGCLPPAPTMTDQMRSTILPGSASTSSRSRPLTKPTTSVRKRGTTSSSTSTFVSPALRPKISPAIKPLLPKDSPLSLSPEAHTLLLASKSNFQRILDGTVLPGSFPDDLTRELHSKRASHKLAEQGRRNRINSALMELQTLLPPDPTGAITSAKTSPDVRAKTKGKERDGEYDDQTCGGRNMDQLRIESDGGEGGGGKQKPGGGGCSSSGSSSSAVVQPASLSKASTVESAIVYIRQLLDDASGHKLALEQKERQVEDLQRQLADLASKISATASNSPGRDR